MLHKPKNVRLFDDWHEKYDQWFATPVGTLVKKYEGDLILDLLRPRRGERILDAGCGTGIFSLDTLSLGAHLIGTDISFPMLMRAGEKARQYPFQVVLADMLSLPFQRNSFDKVISVAAIEFIEEAKDAVRELFRVTKRGGIIVVATLNSLSPWASRRMEQAKRGHPIFKKAIFRSPDELRSLASIDGIIKTAIHFQKEDELDHASEIERVGQKRGLSTGAFLAVRWEKP